MRVRINHAPGGWRDEGPGATGLSAHLSGSLVIGYDLAKTICSMPLTTGTCGRYTGHMGVHHSREAMDRELQRKRMAA
jgi:hypothetical protein